jgi:NAD(P)-dependent dehydrogenase (short-subunit alcohol dehydrogenase family)
MDEELNRQYRRWRTLDETGRDDDADAAFAGLVRGTLPQQPVSSEFTARTMQAVVAAAEREFGKVDILVNNAGISGTYQPDLTSTEAWDRVMDINAKGVFLGMKHAVPAMRRAGGGAIVNISSISALRPRGLTPYTVSKGAVIALTRSVAREVGADGITVNAVAPGLVETDATRALNDADYLAASAGRRAVPRAMEPGDLAPVVSFLCSEGSGFVTGQTLIVDGGVAFS